MVGFEIHFARLLYDFVSRLFDITWTVKYTCIGVHKLTGNARNLRGVNCPLPTGSSRYITSYMLANVI